MMQQRFGITYNEGYGMTETASFLHANPPQRAEAQLAWACRRRASTRASSTRDAAASCRTARSARSSPMRRRSCKGYWRNAAGRPPTPSSRSTASASCAPATWRCVDEDGYFFMRDRLKRMINVVGLQGLAGRGGEHAVRAPGRARGLRDRARPMRAQGEAVKALVVLKPGFARGATRRTDRLVPRADGGLQGAALRRVRRRAAQVEHRQDPVARAAGQHARGRNA